MSDVKQQLQVDAAGGKVLVTITAENASGKPVFVPKAVYAAKQIMRREFVVKDMPGGTEVDYTGPMVKRGPFTKDDFVPLKPGQKLSHSIDITASYAFKPGHTYQIAYEGGYLADAAKVETVTPSAPAPVTFSFKK